MTKRSKENFNQKIVTKIVTISYSYKAWEYYQQYHKNK
jgi:peptide methionine sulfoxide reductase MsrA